MKERPILFSTPMVRAILEGKKTQTRRLIKPQPAAGVRNSVFVPSGLEDGHGRELQCSYGGPGDRLWVREAIGIHIDPVKTGLEGVCVYRADFPDGPNVTFEPRWTPSIHMPRWASRITLEITGVRVERLRQITESDAQAEGCTGEHFDTALSDFIWLWDKINGKREGWAWANNPWVWVVEFARA